MWPLLQPLAPAERRRLLEQARPRHYARDEPVFHEGDPGRSLHLVAVGRFAVRVATPDGDAATINVLGPGDYFGELALLRGTVTHRTASVVALEQAQTMAISGPAFHALCDTHPALERLLANLLAERVAGLSQRLLEALHVGVEVRVCRRLDELTRMYDQGRAPVTIPLTQSDLADLAGATRPTVNQVLQALATDGVVTLGRGKVSVLDPAALHDRART